MTVPLIEVATEKPPDVGERDHRRFLNHALRATATQHMILFLPRHFENVPENRPGGEYGYVQPSKKHMIRKARKYKHQTPNVFSGAERQHVIANARVTATYRVASIKTTSKHTRRADLGRDWRESLQATSERERQVARETVHNMYHDQLAEHRRNRQRVRIS